MLKKLTAWMQDKFAVQSLSHLDSATPALQPRPLLKPPHKMSNLNPHYLELVLLISIFYRGSECGLERSRILPRVSCEMGDGDVMQKSHPKTGESYAVVRNWVVTREQACKSQVMLQTKCPGH